MPKLVTSQVSESRDGNTFVVDNLVITDSDAVEFLKGLKGSERYKAVSTAVHFGLLALRDFGTITRVDWIDKRFQSFETRIKDTFEEVGEELKDYLGENGKLERDFSDANGPFRSLLDPHAEGSPLYELRQALEESIQELHNAVIGEQAAEEEAEFGTRKGFRFEDELYEFLQPHCSSAGDRIEKIGTRKDAGRKAGDLLIQVNEPHLRIPVRIVIEAKSASTQVHGSGGLLEEMDTALQIRKAQYAIGVVKKQNGLRGVKGCFAHILPDKVLCTFGSDGSALEIAYRFARAEVLLQTMGAHTVDKPTCSAINSRMVDIRTKLRNLSNAKSHLTNIETSTAELRQLIDTLQTGILGTIGEVDALIRKQSSG